MTGRLRALAPAIVTWTTIIIASAGMMLTSFSGHPMSVVDEHVHYDYALKVAQGEIPHRGSLFEDAVVQEWACGVGHEAGGLTDRCGDPGLGVDDLPSGPYTSGYGHYPTFFALANVYKLAVDAVSDAEPIDVYRSFSALCMIAALVASWFIAGAIGLARWHRAAATLLPFASASMLFMGSIINPGSTALLSGVLIAGAGIRWMQTGRGLVLLLLASTFASLLAVINSLPAIAVGIAMALVILLRRLGWEVSGRWQPKVWHVVALAATTVVPVVIWGRVISATATVSNETLFGFAALTGWGDALSGLVAELFSLHTPWLENERLDPESGVFLVLRAPAEGLPVWITILVVAALVITVFIAWHVGGGRREPRLVRVGARRRGPRDARALPAGASPLEHDHVRVRFGDRLQVLHRSGTAARLPAAARLARPRGRRDRDRGGRADGRRAIVRLALTTTGSPAPRAR